MRLNELQEKYFTIDLSSESKETQNRLATALNNFNNIDKKWKERVSLAELAKKENWSEEQYNAECKKRSI